MLQFSKMSGTITFFATFLHIYSKKVGFYCIESAIFIIVGTREIFVTF